MSSTSISDFHAVVPAGGAGTRLWPLSRRDHPKFLLDLTGSGRTLLQQTWDRLVPLAGRQRIVIVTGTAHTAEVADQLPGLPPEQLLPEPSGRDSMAAIGLAAALLHHRHGECLIGSFAADHRIGNEAAFARAVHEATAAARAGYLTTIGITPDSPATAYGYIRAGGDLSLPQAPSTRHVDAFLEKPDVDTATSYVASGDYRWNAGMFIVSTTVLLNHLARLQPHLHDGLQAIAAAWDTPHRQAVLAERWQGLTRIAIDHAIAEPVAAEGGVAVVPAELDWDDVGDFASLARLHPSGELSNGPILSVNSAGGLLAADSGRTLAVAGIPGAVVIDAEDALLVTTTAYAQQLGSLVEQLPDHLR